ncbi:translin-associated factor X-interacting protein 1-like isoform X2 [Carassius auratus]|uniref:Translin-associated factor X-interacting protein 1-like isoform X2 n=1 Tax=Carassius auratus TaxID=7957 RepID=A0A6P6LSY9_CARAU|nr:translin-associated factor X-interacting protein 1-like isoform X2 [Carassius auratus]XP_026086597.1 translin-associated factor X-interacting protein 1-like isoform X2 [Carassius auratus]
MASKSKSSDWHLREQIRDLLPLRGKLVLVSKQCEKKILEQRVQEREEIRTLKRESQRLQRVIESMREQQTALQIQDTTGRHEVFLSLVKKQATSERPQYNSELRVQLECKGEMDAEHLWAAFKTIHPSLDSETLDWNISVVFSDKAV